MEDQIKDARASVLVDAPRSRVWQALTDPDIVRQYFLGTQLTTTWQVGEPVTFAGEWKGKSYQDKGIVLENRHEEILRITHYSPLTGLPDEPDNYHIVEYRLDETPAGTRVTITQGNNKSDSEAEESAKLWEIVLGNLKELLER